MVGLAAAAGTLLGAFLTAVLLLVRVSARWATVEADLRHVIVRLDTLVSDNNAVHASIMTLIGTMSDRMWELHTAISQQKGK